MLAEQPIANYNGKPEIDDGHTKIANELLDAIISHDLSKRQLKILLFIIRKTYGWNKSQDDISRSQIVEATKLHNPHVTTAIQELVQQNILIVSNGYHAKNYKINKYYDSWRDTETVIITKTVPVTKTVTITETVTDCYQNGNISLPKQSPQKTTPKDNTKDSDLFETLWAEYPKRLGGNNKQDAIKQYNARLKQGNTHEQMLIGVINYSKEMVKLKNINTPFIKQASAFLGKSLHFMDYQSNPVKENKVIDFDNFANQLRKESFND